MDVVNLHAAKSSAVIYPKRGGLLSELNLFDKASGSSRAILWPGPVSETKAKTPPPGSGWPGGGLPILFPFAGRTYHENRPLHYYWSGEIYQMPMHGIAYGLPWRLGDCNESQVTLTLTNSTASQVFYPFEFTLTANYHLQESCLTLHLTIQASSSNRSPMPVASGFHPYLALDPIGSRWQLQANAASVIQVTASGLGGKASERQPEALLELQAPLSKNCILSSLDESLCHLIDPVSDRKVVLDWRGELDENPLQKVVLWNDGSGRFHCVEPWMGLPNAVNNGVGLKELAPGTSLQLDLRLSTE